MNTSTNKNYYLYAIYRKHRKNEIRIYFKIVLKEGYVNSPFFYKLDNKHDLYRLFDFTNLYYLNASEIYLHDIFKKFFSDFENFENKQIQILL